MVRKAKAMGHVALSLFLALFCATTQANAESTSSNTGLTGLWEYPTAEIPADGHGRFGYTHASPYAFYFIDLAWLPWLEVNARLTTFDNLTAASTTERYYMDKAIDLKAVLYKSDKWYLPSLALGIQDIMGTELMKSYYGVATWRLGQFSVTAGYGTDRMNGVFAGIAWDATDWLTVKAEYSPLDYTADKVGSRSVHSDKADSKFNYGIVLKAPWGTEASVSRQRNEEWAFTISQRFNLNGPFLFGDGMKKKNITRPGEARVAEWEDVEINELIRNIEKGLEKYVRVRDVEIEIGDKTVLVAYENYGHASHAEAMVRVLVVLSAVLPQVDSLTLVPRIHGVPVVSAEFPGSLLFDIRARSLRGTEFLQPAVFAWAKELPKTSGGKRSGEAEGAFEVAGGEGIGSGGKFANASVLSHRAQHEIKGMIVYEPRIDQTIEDEYLNRWSLDLIYQGRYSKGWGAYADIRFPLYNNVDIWWEPDMDDTIRINQAAGMYIGRWDNKDHEPIAWFFGEAGYLDEEYFGVNLWGRYYSKDGRWWVGARLALQRDRDPESFAGLMNGILEYENGNFNGKAGRYYDSGSEPWRKMAWVQAGYNFANPNLDLQADYGRFADSDTGVKLSAVRHWDDTSLGFWWIRTDRLTTGKDYTRAGVHLEIPAEKWFGNWFGRSSEHIWEQDTLLLSTWRIDAGREGGHVRTPERLMGQLRPVALKRDVAELLEDYCSFEEEKERDRGPKSLAELVGIKE